MDLKLFVYEIEIFGFEKVLDIPFVGRGNYKEHFYVYFCKKYGIILQFDTYGEIGLNGGYYYYQWKVSKEWVIKEEERLIKGGKNGYVGYHLCLSSGGFIGDKFAARKLYDMIWYGHGDCRSNMIHSIKQLANDGTFITPWAGLDGIMSPTFVHYGDHMISINSNWGDGYKLYEEALRMKTPDRFKMLPKYVQTAICKGMREESMNIKTE